MRPPWLSGNSDDDEDSSSEEEVIEETQGSSEKDEYKIKVDDVDDNALRDEVLGAQEDEKNVERLLSQSTERISKLTNVWLATHKKSLNQYFDELTKAGSNSDSIKELLQRFSGEQGAKLEEEVTLTLQFATQVEKAADRASIRAQPSTITAQKLLDWLTLMKSQRKLSGDQSNARVFALRNASDKVGNASEIDAIRKDILQKDEEFYKKLVQDSEKKHVEEQERQKRRHAYIKGLQKEQMKRTKDPKSKSKKK